VFQLVIIFGHKYIPNTLAFHDYNFIKDLSLPTVFSLK